MNRKTPGRLGLVALFMLSVAGCDPCADYCDLECSCNFDDSESCRQTCTATLEVFTGEARNYECIERMASLEEECG